MTTTQPLPRWDMSVVYPDLSSSEFAQGFTQTVQDIADLAHLFDTYHVRQQSALVLNEEVVQAFETVITRYNEVLDRVRTLAVYISCFVNTNSHDDVAQARMSELQGYQVQLSQLSTRFTAWLGSMDVEALLECSALAQNHAFALRQAKEQAQHLMSPDEEMLVAELYVSGGAAWAKLHGNLTSQLMVPV